MNLPELPGEAVAVRVNSFLSMIAERYQAEVMPVYKNKHSYNLVLRWCNSFGVPVGNKFIFYWCLLRFWWFGEKA
jgi:hypothetical protein